jgi:hypothetical protein
MTSWLSIHDQAVGFDEVTLAVYHCESSMADCAIGMRSGQTWWWLAATIEPAPKDLASLSGAVLRVDLPSLDEFGEHLLAKAIGIYPPNDEMCLLAEVNANGQVRVAGNFACSCEPELQTFDELTDFAVAMDLTGTVTGFHMGRLPT